jgi:hypothetical protein
MQHGQDGSMPGVTAIVKQGLAKTLHAVKLIVVAVVCLLIGVTARHLFDAYGKEMVPFLKGKRVEAETRVVAPPRQEIPLPRKPVEPFWNR